MSARMNSVALAVMIAVVAIAAAASPWSSASRPAAAMT